MGKHDQRAKINKEKSAWGLVSRILWRFCLTTWWHPKDLISSSNDEVRHTMLEMKAWNWKHEPSLNMSRNLAFSDNLVQKFLFEAKDETICTEKNKKLWKKMSIRISPV
jgi:hypothetical protein